MHEPERLTRAYEAEIADVLPGERAVVAVISTAALDRFKTVIEPLGVDLNGYRSNPVVLWEHGKDPARGKLPIGRNLWIKPRRGEQDLIAKTVFGDDEFADRVFRLYQDGTLKGFSIDGLSLPGQNGPPTAEEIRRRPELAACKCVYRRLDLCEYSAVSVPGNAGALALAVSRGLWVPDEVRAQLPPPLPPLRGRTFAQVEAALLNRTHAAATSLAREALRDARDLARGDI